MFKFNWNYKIAITEFSVILKTFMINSIHGTLKN